MLKNIITYITKCDQTVVNAEIMLKKIADMFPLTYYIKILKRLFNYSFPITVKIRLICFPRLSVSVSI